MSHSISESTTSTQVSPPAEAVGANTLELAPSTQTGLPAEAVGINIDNKDKKENDEDEWI